MKSDRPIWLYISLLAIVKAITGTVLGVVYLVHIETWGSLENVVWWYAVSLMVFSATYTFTLWLEKDRPKTWRDPLRAIVDGFVAGALGPIGALLGISRLVEALAKYPSVSHTKSRGHSM